METVDDHHSALVRVESGLQSGAGRYALAVAGVGLGEVHALTGDAVERGSMGNAVDETHALVLHLVAHQDEDIGLAVHVSSFIVDNGAALIKS